MYLHHFQVATAIEKLIEEHQRIPGNILTALIERVHEMPKKMKPTNEATPEKQTNGTCHNGTVKLTDDALSDSCQNDKQKVS